MKPADGSQAFDRGAPFFNDLAIAILRAALATSACAKCRECTVLDFCFLSYPPGQRSANPLTKFLRYGWTVLGRTLGFGQIQLSSLWLRP